MAKTTETKKKSDESQKKDDGPKNSKVKSNESIETLKKIEGAFMMFCTIKKEPNLKMCCDGKKIWFNLNKTDSNYLNRTKLNKLPENEMIILVHDELKAIYDKETKGNS